MGAENLAIGMVRWIEIIHHADIDNGMMYGNISPRLGTYRPGDL
jgi:hypothetical protein